jgi:hypothetical protein
MEQESPKKSSVKTKEKTWKLKNLPRSFVARASESEHEKLKRMALRADVSVSRLVIETTLSKPLMSADDAERERADREETIFQLRRIGINLNQITSALHAVRRGVKASVTETRLEETAAEIESVISLLKKKL